MDKTIPIPAAAILNLIGKTEAPQGYDTIYGNNQRHLAKPLTTMTLGEVMQVQAMWTRKYGSSAAGRYQFMNATLKDLKAELGLHDTQVFNADLQDRLGYHLLRRRGYDNWAVGKISDQQLMLGLAKEWASFPVPYRVSGAHRVCERGQSYYAGDGVNKALVKTEVVEALLDNLRADLIHTPAPIETKLGLTNGDELSHERVSIPDPAHDVAPEVLHLTNNEPWYQSRVTLGSLASIIVGIGGLFGYALGMEQTLTLLTAVGPIIGGAVALYGRWVATKPIGA